MPRKKKAKKKTKEEEKMGIEIPDILGLKKKMPEVPEPQQKTEVKPILNQEKPQEEQKLPQDFKYFLDNYMIQADNNNLSLIIGLLYANYVETKKLRELIEQNK